jgi:hypothetical protein
LKSFLGDEATLPRLVPWGLGVLNYSEADVIGLHSYVSLNSTALHSGSLNFNIKRAILLRVCKESCYISLLNK